MKTAPVYKCIASEEHEVCVTNNIIIANLESRRLKNLFASFNFFNFVRSVGRKKKKKWTKNAKDEKRIFQFISDFHFAIRKYKYFHRYVFRPYEKSIFAARGFILIFDITFEYTLKFEEYISNNSTEKIDRIFFDRVSLSFDIA